MKIIITALFLCFNISIQSQSPSVYADTIIDSFYSKTNPYHSSFYGGNLKTGYRAISVDRVLGNNEDFVSLPINSYIIVGFSDTYIIDAPNQKDIFIREIGGAGDLADVYVSYNNKQYVYLGLANDNVINEFDLSDISFKLPVRYIKVVGKDYNGASPGFDLVSVSGLSGAYRMSPVSLDEEIPDILTNIPQEDFQITIRFKTNEFLLDSFYIPKALLIKDYLIKDTACKVLIKGHTDSVGSEEYNYRLSKKRVGSLYNFFIENGVNPELIEEEYYGETMPIAPNNTEQGRAQNRRVDIELIYKQNITADTNEIEHVKPGQFKPTEIEKFEVGDTVRFHNILFKPCVSIFQSDSYTVLDALIKSLQHNEDLKIKILGHINYTSANPHNFPNKDSRDLNSGEPLSLERAKAVYTYLVKNGIDESRLSYEGLGGIYPIIKEDNMNMRVEIEILEK